MIRIGMMVNGLAPWPLGRLIELDQVTLDLFAPSGINWGKRTIFGLHLKSGRWVERRSPFPEAVYNRCYSDQSNVIARLENVIGKRRIFNYVTRFDKWEIHQVLQSGGLGDYLPQTFLFEERRLGQVLETNNGIVVKPRLGHSGKGVYLLKRTDTEGIQAFNGLASKPTRISPKVRGAWDVSQIMQQEISMLKWDDSVFDIRLLMQKDKNGKWRTSGDLSRLAVPGIFVTNVCKKICYAEEVLVQVGHDPRKVLAKLKSISRMVARILEKHFVMLGEISVDFALDTEGKVWIIEVNGKPDRNLFFALRDEELIRRILVRPLEYACYLATQPITHE